MSILESRGRGGAGEIEAVRAGGGRDVRLEWRRRIFLERFHGQWMSERSARVEKKKVSLFFNRRRCSPFLERQKCTGGYGGRTSGDAHGLR